MTDFSEVRRPPQTAPRTVVAYHGCTQETADVIFSERRFFPSTLAYDWLGEGVYFWEYAPYRALQWAADRCAVHGGMPAVIRATIRLGNCLNLLDIKHTPNLHGIYASMVSAVGSDRMPRNTDAGAHFLDRSVIDGVCRFIVQETDAPIHTVRGSYAEGAPIFPGSKILQNAHTQIAVRDSACIVRASLVRFKTSHRHPVPSEPGYVTEVDNEIEEA